MVLMLFAKTDICFSGCTLAILLITCKLRFGYLVVQKCSTVYRAESVFAMLTKDYFGKVRGGIWLDFLLHFYQVHVGMLRNIFSWKSKNRTPI